MSLADELLADLEEGGEDVEQSEDDMEAEVADIDDVAITTIKPTNTVKNVAKLQGSKEVSLLRLSQIWSEFDLYYLRHQT